MRGVGGTDLQLENEADYGDCGVTWGTNTSQAAQALHVLTTTDIRYCISEIELDGNLAGAAVQAGDIVNFIVRRYGADVADTCNDVYLVGEYIEYLGYNRR